MKIFSTFGLQFWGIGSNYKGARKTKLSTFVTISVADSVPDPDPHVLDLPDPDPLVRGMDPDPDPSISKQKW